MEISIMFLYNNNKILGLNFFLKNKTNITLYIILIYILHGCNIIG